VETLCSLLTPLALQELNHALARGASIYAHLASYAATAHHLTQPLATGDGAYRSMKRALEAAQIPPRCVSYINAHATSTPLGDAAEASAIRRLMLGSPLDGGRGGSKLRHEQDVCVSSTKGATGHLLGASGALEAMFSVLSVKEDVVPPTMGLEEVDGALPAFDYVQGSKQERRVDVALSNSFGFGGTNATLCFKKWEG
jgi:3-oxoacyl-[acyl-carrier-protein] synthase II